MPKGDKINTIKKILQVAEELFSEKGFNGTSVNMIAEKAGVNKALIYYHFKNKDDIVNSLFESIIKESDEYISRSADVNTPQVNEISIQDAIKEEISYMQKKKKILAVMLMESLKGDDTNSYFFKCAEKVVESESNGILKTGEYNEKNSEEIQRYLVHEFFTGFVPIIAFVVFRDKWCDYYKYDVEQFTKYFLDSFNETHLSSKKLMDHD